MSPELAETPLTPEEIRASVPDKARTILRRSAPQIACDAVRRCRDDEMAELANLVFEQSAGLALTMRDALNRKIAPRLFPEELP